MSGRLIFYDTSNYIDFPVGGQLTSVRNFLRFLKDYYSQYSSEVLLVGVSTDEKAVGQFSIVMIDNIEYKFIAVTHATANLGDVKKSLRLEYMKGILKYRELIGLQINDCNYIHTPEAFGAVRLIKPRATCYVFSHGTYKDMWQRVRFFKKMPIVRKVFQAFLMYVIKKSTAVFVLEKETQEDYLKYNDKVIHVGNSIVCHDYEEKKLHEDSIRFIYAGRLSAVKNVGPIIEAVNGYHRECELVILGDGEERTALMDLANESDRISFKGAVSPTMVQQFMKESDILVLNSVFEGIPMIMLEAISLGLPIITTNVGGIKEVLTFGKDSEVTDGSIIKIREAMDKICAEYKSYSISAYEKSLKFDYRKVNEKIFDILNEKLKWERSFNDSEQGRTERILEL